MQVILIAKKAIISRHIVINGFEISRSSIGSILKRSSNYITVAELQKSTQRRIFLLTGKAIFILLFLLKT